MSKRILVVEDQEDNRQIIRGEEQKARAAGCDEHVPKPYSPRQLLAKIREYLP
jgi:CheY-like chemotaxis protein